MYRTGHRHGREKWKKRGTGKNERIRFKGTSNESPEETVYREIREQKHELKYLLPTYAEGEDIDVFLRSFERLANLHKWPKPE